ncbi:ImuA family protein [Chitinophaga sp. RCC_12]|uniref:ImuA family protein n=1 Tax=Chitinophaga sp. RCC_12 TaxID=3239226 RepID=UPI0035244454
MPADKAAIIAGLQRDILLLQGFKQASNTSVDMGLGRVTAAFPNATFPTGAIHEFMSAAAEHTAAATGFIGGLLNALMQGGGACIWISTCRTLFPPALKTFGIEPERIIFVDLKREKDVLWAMEEALKCEGLAAVIGEVRDIGFTASRRLQLAVEQSRVTGFIIRRESTAVNTTACVSRWRITPLASEPEDGLPGVGYPRWNVELLKIRNGKPGTWQIEWSAGRFRLMDEQLSSAPPELIRKIG